MTRAALLRQLADATRMYVEVIRTVAPELAGVEAYQGVYDELGIALRADEQGTPARIAEVVADALAGVVRRPDGGRV